MFEVELFSETLGMMFGDLVCVQTEFVLIFCLLLLLLAPFPNSSPLCVRRNAGRQLRFP